MIIRSAKVPLIALVGIADDVFLRARRVENGLPFDAGREARAAAAAKAGLGHLGDDIGRRQGHGAFQALQPVMGPVVARATADR